MAGPAAVVRAATALLRAESRRQIWAVDGRARVEVGGLAEVSWARVDVVTDRAAMRFDSVFLGVPDLVAAAQTAGGVRSDTSRARRPSLQMPSR